MHARDAFWYEKHHQSEIAQEKAVHAKEDEAHGGIHMPFQSIYPLVTSIGILIGSIGVSVLDPGHKLVLALIGGVVMLGGIYWWAMEGNEGYHIHADEEESHK